MFKSLLAHVPLQHNLVLEGYMCTLCNFYNVPTVFNQRWLCKLISAFPRRPRASTTTSECCAKINTGSASFLCRPPAAFLRGFSTCAHTHTQSHRWTKRKKKKKKTLLAVKSRPVRVSTVTNPKMTVMCRLCRSHCGPETRPQW